MTRLTLDSVAVDSPGAGKVTAVFSYADATVTQPAQRMSVGDLPAGNANWSRALILTDANYIALRYPSSQAAIAVAALNEILAALVTGLTWAPVVTTHPAADTVSAASGTAEFTVVASSEFETATYQWQESSDGSSYGNVSDGGIYSGATTATLTIDPTDTSKNGYYYRCVVTNSVGSTNSNGAIMTVTA